ncbi:MAG: ABC transporter permease subunit [Anaerolineae bacterium]
MISLLLKELRMHRGGIIGWAVGLGLWGGLVPLLYPSVGTQFARIDLPDFYAAFGPVGALGELSAFLTLEVFNFAIPIGLAIYGLVLGVGVLAGEEDDGTLELWMALPTPRWQLVLAKALSIAVSLAIVVAGLCLSTWLGILAIEEEAIRDGLDVSVGAEDLALVALQSWLLVLALAMIVLFLGAYLPHRKQATLVGTVVIAVSYLLDSLAEITEKLDPYRWLSLSHYYDVHALMTSGFIWEDAAVLGGIAAVFLVLALLSFERRNVTVGAWPWQRPRVTEQA